MRSQGEPGGQPALDRFQLDPGQQRPIQGRQAKGLYSKGLLAPIRKHNRAAIEVHTPNKESGLLNLDLAAEVTYLDDELGLLGKIDNRTIELFS